MKILSVKEKGWGALGGGMEGKGEGGSSHGDIRALHDLVSVSECKRALHVNTRELIFIYLISSEALAALGMKGCMGWRDLPSCLLLGLFRLT